MESFKEYFDKTFKKCLIENPNNRADMVDFFVSTAKKTIFSYLCDKKETKMSEGEIYVKDINILHKFISENFPNKLFECGSNNSQDIIDSRYLFSSDPANNPTEKFSTSISMDFDSINFIHTTINYMKDFDVYDVSLSILGINANSIYNDILKLDGVKDNCNFDEKSYVYMLVQANGLYLRATKVEPVNFMEYNYSGNVVDQYNYIMNNIYLPEPPGRLVIINGAPGTGKTYFIRNLITSAKGVSYIYVPAKFAGNIDSPELISLLLQHKEETKKPIALIIEDADVCIQDRNEFNLSIISSLLNYTDGILGAALDIRVIATTNAEDIKLDDAVTRSGRLLTKFGINKLSEEEAIRWLNNNDCQEKELKIKGPISLADLYAIKKNATMTEAKEEKKIGF